MQGNDTLIGNYNGVMLCKRPNYEPVKNSGIESLINRKNKTTRTNDMASSSNYINNEKGSFLCGKVPTPWGNTTAKIKSQKNKVLSKLSRNDGALRRHKQWLKNMQEKRDKRLKEKEEAAQLKKEREREFIERQARRRKKIRELEKNECDDNQDNRDDLNEVQNGYDMDITQENKLMSGEKRCRPVWSLTENEAINVNECMRNEEEEDLMKFVDGLDFEQYFDDMELKVLMTQVKNRINQLEKQRKVDHTLLDTVIQSEKLATHNEKYNNLNHDNTSYRKDDYDTIYHGKENDEINSIAESIRSCTEASMTSIHSHKSIQMLVARSRNKLQQTNDRKELNPISEEYPSEISLKLPVTITHTEDNGARLAETKSLNKLPFKNRNPAL